MNSNLETIAEKLARIAERTSSDTISYPVKKYTRRDIIELMKSGKSNEYISDKLGASESELERIRPAVDAHFTMGTYSRYAYKIRNRELTEREKMSIYQDVKKGMGSEKLSEKYRITRMRAMAFHGWDTRKSNKD